MRLIEKAAYVLRHVEHFGRLLFSFLDELQQSFGVIAGNQGNAFVQFDVLQDRHEAVWVGDMLGAKLVFQKAQLSGSGNGIGGSDGFYFKDTSFLRGDVLKDVT